MHIIKPMFPETQFLILIFFHEQKKGTKEFKLQNEQQAI